MSRRFVAAFLWLVLAAMAPAQPQDGLEFIQLTDTHVVDLEGVAPQLSALRRHFGGGAAALARFFEQHRPAFFLITGDLTDAFRFTGAGGQPVYGHIETFGTAAARAAAPLYLALGNHDIQHYGLRADGKLDADQAVAGEARAAWAVAVPCFRRGTWYSFARQAGGTRYVFLVLDNGYTAGEISREQMQWLRRQAQAETGAALILAMHVPLAEDANSRAIRTAVAGSGIALVLAGHKHSDAVEEIALGQGTSVQVRTAAFGYGVNNWRKVRLLDGRIEVLATGSSERIEKTIAVSAAKAVGGF